MKFEKEIKFEKEAYKIVYYSFLSV